MKIGQGFSHAEEIRKLAESIYGKEVTVLSEIFGDGHEILIGQETLMKGTSEEVLKRLKERGEK